jgi:replicative DNA helicase
LQISRFAAQYGLLHETVAPAKVLFFSGEMTERQLGTRMLSSMTGVPARTVERGSYNKEQKKLLADAVNDLTSLSLTLVPGARLNTAQIRQIARKLVTSQELDLLVLDGLLQIEALKVHESDSTRRQLYVKQQRRDLIEDIMNDLEDIALTYKLPILLTHQLSRAPAGRQNKRPVLSDLAEASFVEQKSAVVVFLYREGYYDETSQNPNAAELIVAKNRFGGTGTIHQIYDAMYTRFIDADKTTWNFGDPR